MMIKVKSNILTLSDRGAQIVKNWYLKKCLEFLKTRQFKDTEEYVLGEFTNFCLADLDSRLGVSK